MKKSKHVRLTAAVALAVAAAFGVAAAPAEAGTITIVTSFPKDLTQVYKAAFEKANPDIKVEILNKSTSSAIAYVRELQPGQRPDIFWASAPDAFEVMKSGNLLEKVADLANKDAPTKIGNYPLNDPGGMYLGQALAGYGLMWNTRYMRANKVPAPKEWADLTKAAYFGHVAISSPSRSGTTHLTIEAILQGDGWDKGWGTIKAMAGNFRQITERSFGVPDAVNSGQAGYGIVIDFFAFSSQASGFPVKFIYPSVTTIVPANVGIVANAPNKAGAEAFIEYLLSPAGQEVLLEPTIRRLPVNPVTYAKAPPDYPNPFKDERLGKLLPFDADLSESRSAVVDTLFDQLITFQLDALKGVTRSIHAAEAALAKKDNPRARALIGEARQLIAAMPINATQASSPEIRGAFTGGKQKGARQAELESQWAAFAKERYAQAQAKADEAAKLAR